MDEEEILLTYDDAYDDMFPIYDELFIEKVDWQETTKIYRSVRILKTAVDLYNTCHRLEYQRQYLHFRNELLMGVILKN